MRIDLVTQRLELRRLRRAFGFGRAALRRQRLRLRLRRQIIGAPGGEEEQPHDHCVRGDAELIIGRQLADLRPGDDERRVVGALDAHFVSDLGNPIAFLGNVAELVVRLVEELVRDDHEAGERAGPDERCYSGNCGTAAKSRPGGEQRDDGIDAEGQDNAGSDNDAPVRDDRARVVAEECPGNHREQVEEPETEDRFDG